MAKTPEGKIQLAIMRHLKQHGVLFFRQEPNNYNHQLGRYISNPYAMKGVSDIIAVLPGGQACFIEVKTKRGRQSADQTLFQKRVELLGARYILARGVDDVKCLTE